MTNKNKSRRQEDEAFAKARYIKGGERKLNLLAQLIRGKSAQQALIDLEFARQRVSGEVLKVLQSAIANAENNHGLDVDRLYVKEATVGRTLMLKRMHTRGRGKSARVEKPFSNITIFVKERGAVEETKKAKTVKTKEKSDKTAKTSAGKKTASKGE